MLRHRLVRQSALNASSSSESTSMPSPQPTRRRGSQDSSRLYRQISSESLDSLLGPAEPYQSSRRSAGARRHSVACGVLYVDIQKPSLKSALNSAIKRMSSACSVLSSAPSSTYNLSVPQTAPKKEEEVLLPQVLNTFRQPRAAMAAAGQQSNGACATGAGVPPKKTQAQSSFLVNRRFSTDCPPPTYTEATNLWKQPVARPKFGRQMMMPSKESLVDVEDDDSQN